jgi:hypothetical protein
MRGFVNSFLFQEILTMNENEVAKMIVDAAFTVHKTWAGSVGIGLRNNPCV